MREWSYLLAPEQAARREAAATGQARTEQMSIPQELLNVQARLGLFRVGKRVLGRERGIEAVFCRLSGAMGAGPCVELMRRRVCNVQASGQRPAAGI